MVQTRSRRAAAATAMAKIITITKNSIAPSNTTPSTAVAIAISSTSSSDPTPTRKRSHRTSSSSTTCTRKKTPITRRTNGRGRPTKRRRKKDATTEVTPSPAAPPPTCRRRIQSDIEQEVAVINSGTTRPTTTTTTTTTNRRRCLPPGVVDLADACTSAHVSSAFFLHGSVGGPANVKRVCSGTVMHPDWTLSYVSSYGEDYYEHLLAKERRCRRKVMSPPSPPEQQQQQQGRKKSPAVAGARNVTEGAPQYMTIQKHLTVSMREILVDWLIELAHEYKLLTKTLHLAVGLVDRALEVLVVRRNELQCVGCACMLIACKLEEIHAPVTDDFVYISDSTYDKKQIVAMELSICTTLNFDLQIVTPYHFIHRYVQASDVSCGLPTLTSNPYFEFMVEFLLELSLLQYRFVDERPSLIMAAVIYLARATLGLVGGEGENWTKTLEFYTGYKANELKETVLTLHKAQLKPEESELNCVYEKYEKKEFLEVATRPPLLAEDLGFSLSS